MVRLSIFCLLLGLYGVQALFCGNNYQKHCVARNRCRVGSETGTPQITFRFVQSGNEGCPAAETCCPLEETSLFPITNQVPYRPMQGCGNVNRNGLTFTMTNSGDTAQEGELPWMVVLLDAQYLQPIGGGSLITPAVVLTTASVIRNLAENQFIVRAGEWDLHTKTEQLKHEDVLVRKIVRHAGFNEITAANNVALLFLDRPLQLSRHINLICLPPANWKFSRNRCIVSGWGKKNWNDISYMNLLKKIEVPLVDRDTCQRQLQGIFTSAFQLDSSLICAGGEAGKDSCEGDGGAPLACPIQGDPTRYEQVGIVNFGVGCGDPIAAAYTDVSKMRPWIDYQIDLDSGVAQGNPGPVQVGVGGSQTHGPVRETIANGGYGLNGYPPTRPEYYPSEYPEDLPGGVGGGGLPGPVLVSDVWHGTGGSRYGPQGGVSIGINGNGLNGYGLLQREEATVGSNVYDANRFQGPSTLGNSRFDQNGYLGSDQGGGRVGPNGNNNNYQGQVIQGGGGFGLGGGHKFVPDEQIAKVNPNKHNTIKFDITTTTTTEGTTVPMEIEII
ncbi:phenoloxidase-activating factor 2 [Drosophila takahashii]|uniref:phenoloxidase-activating factor 2 n=1 Tax=Drosophila takahashii TaxID=29030 RepID=UPI001CF91F50|nr:phenoloxidase-activating factor 2 [Drosophila takahashii]